MRRKVIILFCKQSNFGQATLNNTRLLYCKLHEANFTNTKGENPKFSFPYKRSAFFRDKVYTARFINSVLTSSLAVDSTLASGWFNGALLENFSCINSDLSSSVFDCTGRRVTLVGVNWRMRIFQIAS